MFRHDLRPSDSPVLPTSAKGSPRHNYEFDVNGFNYDGARSETSDPKPRTRTVGRRDARPVDHSIIGTADDRQEAAAHMRAILRADGGSAIWLTFRPTSVMRGGIAPTGVDEASFGRENAAVSPRTPQSHEVAPDRVGASEDNSGAIGGIVGSKGGGPRRILGDHGEVSPVGANGRDVRQGGIGVVAHEGEGDALTIG